MRAKLVCLNQWSLHEKGFSTDYLRNHLIFHRRQNCQKVSFLIQETEHHAHEQKQGFQSPENRLQANNLISRHYATVSKWNIQLLQSFQHKT
jgi:hypothetical protein